MTSVYTSFHFSFDRCRGYRLPVCQHSALQLLDHSAISYTCLFGTDAEQIFKNDTKKIHKKYRILT